MKNEFEQRLTEFPAQHLEGIDTDLAPVKISLITFAFDNKVVIDALTKRGKAIQNEKWEKMDKVNKSILDQLKKEKKGKSLLDKMQQPVSCFVTLETEEGKVRADMYNEFVQQQARYHRYRTFLGDEIDVKPANEPTDIIWENRRYTSIEKF